MASSAVVPAGRIWLAAAFVGALMLLLAPLGAQAQEAGTLPASVEEAVIAGAAAEAEVDEGDVEILRSDEVTWNDGCLGVEAEGEACTQALVDGYVVWAVAGGEVYRFHTDEQSEVRLGESGIATSEVADAPLPDGATARGETDGETPDPGSIISGEIPSEGVALIQVTADATTEEIRTELSARGCSSDTLAKTVDGQWYIYSYDAPDWVNENFFSSDGSTSGSVQAETILMTDCETGGATPSPTPSPSPTPTPDGDDGDFSTEPVDESDREGSGALADVTVEAQEGSESVVFEFADEISGPTELAEGVPAYSVEYQTDPTQCGSGFPVELDGEAMLVINFPMTFAYDPETGDALVTEPELGGDIETIMGIEQSCAFEGVSTWVIGVGSEAGFQVTEESDPTRLVVEIETQAAAE